MYLERRKVHFPDIPTYEFCNQTRSFRLFDCVLYTLGTYNTYCWCQYVCVMFNCADPSDFTALTPGHFLVGRILTLLAEPDSTGIPLNRVKRWKLVSM